MYVTVAFIDLSFSFVTQILIQKNMNWKFQSVSKSSMIATWVILLSGQVGYIIAFFVVLHKNQNNLQNKEFDATYGAIMLGLNPKNKNLIYVYPVFMAKRLMFSLITLIFYNLIGL